MKTAVSTPAAPAAIGPYSQGLRAGGMLFLSGQIPTDPATGQLVGGSIGDQTTRAMHNLGAVLAAAGCGFGDVVRTTIYLTDLAHFAKVNETYGAFFQAPYPARATV